jgi:hypothetical protein
VTETAIQWSVVLLKFFVAGGAGMLGFVGLSEFVGGRAAAAASSPDTPGVAAPDGRKRVNTIAIIIALALLAAGGCAAFIQLGRPASIMSVARNISSGSPVSLEFLACAACLVVGVAYLLVTIRESPATTRKVLGIIATITAVAVGFTGGYSHQAMVGMTAWHSPTVSYAFLSSALVLGGFLYLTLLVAFGRGTPGKALSHEASTDASVKTMTQILVGLSLLSTIALVANGLAIPLGAASVLYWTLVPLAGGAVPLACATLMLRRPSFAWACLGTAGAIVGALALRTTVWLAINAGLSKLIESVIIIL